MKKLKIVSVVSVFFIAAQLTGGILANSIAIFTDTAHLASDMIGFAMSMVALKISLRPASHQLTFGWHRAEVIGTLVSVAFLLTLTIWLVVEATRRILKP
jgi:zinc transporter 2